MKYGQPRSSKRAALARPNSSNAAIWLLVMCGLSGSAGGAK